MSTKHSKSQMWQEIDLVWSIPNKLGLAAKGLYEYLRRNFERGTRVCWVSNGELAERLGTSSDVVKQTFNRLKKHHLVDRKFNDQKMRWEIHFRDLSADVKKEEEKYQPHFDFGDDFPSQNMSHFGDSGIEGGNPGGGLRGGSEGYPQDRSNTGQSAPNQMNQLESVETEKEMVGINANDTKSKDHADQPTFLSRKEISDQVISLFQVDQQKGVSWVLSRVSDSNLADLAPSFIQETKHRIENGSFWVIPEKVVDYVTYSFLGGFQGNPTPWASEWKAKYLFLESQKRAKKEDEQRRIEREKEESLRARGGITSMANIVSPERMNQILGEIKF